MIDNALIAAGGIAVFAAGWLGAVTHHTLLSPKGEGSPNVCDDAVTIERLTEELDAAYSCIGEMLVARKALEAENRDLHTDIAEKAKRLSDAGLQSAGGVEG